MSTDFGSKRGLKFDPKFTLSSRVAFHSSDFVEPALVAATEIDGGQEGLHHFHGSFGGDDASAEGEDVGVVVFAGEAGGHHIVGQGGANAGDFVGGDGNADAGAGANRNLPPER